MALPRRIPRSLMTVTAAAALLVGRPALAEELPLQTVILSTAGLAHFEHAGEVDGSTTLELPVRLDQVDDLLKSLVVFDGAGQIGGVSVPGRQPLAEAFRDLPFSRDDLNDPVRLLNALQGAEVRIEGGSSAEGRLVRVTPYQEGQGDAVVERHRVTLLTTEGIRSFPLEQLDNVRFTEPEVQEQIARGLAALHANRVRDQRTLRIDLQGESVRPVALSYVVSAPLWKSAYRLVLPPADAEEGEESLLQGWAVLENQTGSDWNDVQVMLVAGNPVTFRQALYESYYASRPSLPVEVLGRVTPRVDSGNLGTVNEIEAPRLSARAQPSSTGRSLGGFAAGEALADAMPAPMAAMAPMMESEEDVARQAFNRQAMAGTQAATSDDATTQVLFRFPTRFSVQSGHSLMVPFVSQSLEIERVSLYQPDTHPTHPLSSVYLTNDSQAGFPPGILTLYEETSFGGTAFIGDAQVPVMPKGESRYISYALDNKVSIDRQTTGEQRIVSAAIADGFLRQRVVRSQTTTYAIKGAAEEDRTVLIEHPRNSGWEIVRPKGQNVTVTATHYRIRVPVAAAEVESVAVTLERTDEERLALATMSVRDFVYQSNNAGRLDPKLRRAFEEMAELRQAVERLDVQIRDAQSRRERIFEDQRRMRENLARVPTNSDLGRRYLSQMNEQEDQIIALEQQVEDLTREKRVAEGRLREYVGNLTY